MQWIKSEKNIKLYVRSSAKDDHRSRYNESDRFTVSNRYKYQVIKVYTKKVNGLG